MVVSATSRVRRGNVSAYPSMRTHGSTSLPTFAPLILAVGAVLCAAGASGSAGAGRSAEKQRTVALTVRNPRVVVIKSKRVLHLFDGDTLVRSYPIDLGTQPVGTKQIGPDQRTPEGRFRVVTRNPNSPYYRFLGLDYPNENAIAGGLAAGLISQGEAANLRAALRRGARPVWTTALGGGVGIHGHRRGRDWTGGCIALDDANVDELFRVLRIGDPVEILP